MKSIMFNVNLDKVEVKSNDNSAYNPFVWCIEIPTLSAYTVEYFSLNISPLSSFHQGDIITGNTIEFETDFVKEEINSLEVVIYYHGIKDYQALFPWITDEPVRKRLATYYEELEKTFEVKAWLPFVLMCAAVIEGMLYEKLGRPTVTLNEMIEQATENGLLNLNDSSIMHKARKSRNLVHINRRELPYVNRKEALEMRVTIDRLIKHFSF
ncbi:hypothetical protein [Lysinibacillus sp. GbtcB16]|uniref:hypothetical protein n=1 Tax=Lysinibacillus sp. GbtcB16 TaxID=2824761 RepID=UPI001C30D704|nr:hypothetical protein [Lysinibacillus sp. GbtcB16]